MQVSQVQWSDQETAIAESALRTAHQREISALVQTVRDRATHLQQVDDIWHLHDFLSARRFDIDGKYDSRASEILFVLSKLVKEGWVSLDELSGLEAGKLAKITALTRVL